MSKPAWSWKDYERCKRAEERKAARVAAKLAAAQTNSGEVLRPDSTRGPEGRVADNVSAKRSEESPVPTALKQRSGSADMNVSRRSPVDRVVPPKARQACVSPKPAPPIKVDYNPRDPRPAPAPPAFPLAPRFQPAPPPSGKIDISAAPSGMEAAAARWVGKVHAPGTIAEPVPVLCEGKVMCRCGAQGPGQTRGPVPAWFGDRCIEGDCPLRGIAKRKVSA